MDKSINLINDLKKNAATICIFFAVAILLIFIYKVQEIITLVFIAYLISQALSGPVNLMQKKTNWKRGACTGLVYVIFIAIIVLGLSLIIPPLTKQLTDLIKNFNLNDVAQQLNSFGLDISSLDSLIKQIGSLSTQLFSSLASILAQTFKMFTMLILSFHFVIDQGNMQKRFGKISKKNTYQDIYIEFSEFLKKNLGGWIQGEIVLMLIIGIVSYIAFSIIGLPYALPLAVLAGLLELVPNLGPIVSAIPAIAIGFTVNPFLGILTLIICIVIQQAENIFLVPKVMKSAAGINPMISIIAILVGMQLMGVAGALLALPTYIIIHSIYAFFFRDKKHLITLETLEVNK